MASSSTSVTVSSSIDASRQILAQKSSTLKFSISKYSSYSSSYFPDNILEDKPKDQSSRWSSDSNSPPQFLLLKLQRVSIIETITFGKFERTHVCNLKKFKVYGGLNEENMSELLESGLKNDSNPEKFELKHQVNGYSFPCRYIKIVPLQSWGPSFNFSIWYVELKGIDDYDIVQPSINRFNNFQEREAIRVCLKHLRDHNYLDAFESLQKKTKVQLEHPMMTRLHNLLVLQGDYSETEKFLEDCSNSQLFHNFITQQDYKAIWTQLLCSNNFNDENCGEGTRPKMRGGHQMVVDVESEAIYLFGGWDGGQDVADFWSYSIPKNEWTLISANTDMDGGPSARSCHKMVLDSDHRQIFMLGRYVDSQSRPSRLQIKSDFYVYDIESKKWTLITDDTFAYGGPELIFDHQMCIDTDRDKIYVFGGRVLSSTYSVSDNLSGGSSTNELSEENNRFPPSSTSPSSLTSANSELLYSGLYSYHIPTNTWTLLRSDLAAEKKTKETIKSRVGHSMLFHKSLRKLFIFAGQRSKEYLNDFFTYDVDRDEVEIILDDKQKISVSNPASGFTQRATIDPELNEIYVFSGLSKEKDKRDDGVQNSFWVFDIVRKSWSCIYKNDSSITSQNEKLNSGLSSSLEPCPRFAHQLLYDSNSKLHYLFGGNPGHIKDPKLRLNDFWTLRLLRPAKNDILHKCKLLLRKQHFEELATINSVRALHYLQTNISELINHSDPLESREFQKLSLLLFLNSGDETEGSDEVATKEDKLALKRSQIFDKLVRYFPDDMTQPKINLIDLLSF